MSMSKPNFDVNLVKKGNRFIVWSFFNENFETMVEKQGIYLWEIQC